MTASDRPDPEIEILLATFNSERYLAPQLESILKQSDSRWKLSIRDGGSSDRTGELLREFARREPERIRILPGGPAGARENFGELMMQADAELVMFCDHDDVWMPDKLAVSRRAFAAATEGAGAQPLLLFSDMLVVDETLTPLAPSFFRHEHIDPKRVKLPQLLLQNVPSGCTMMINRALLELARPLPPEAVMHDHWLALCAAAFGRLVFLPRATVFYRQHRGNVYGASGYGAEYFSRRARQGLKTIRANLFEKCVQAEAFLLCHREELTPEERGLLADFSTLPDAGFWARRRILWRHRIFKSGWLRNAGMFLVV